MDKINCVMDTMTYFPLATFMLGFTVNNQTRIAICAIAGLLLSCIYSRLHTGCCKIFQYTLFMCIFHIVNFLLHNLEIASH